MSDIKTRKQHFVPRFYLKLFADKNNKFNVYDFQQEKIIAKPVYYGSQCYGKYFYGEDGLWETRLSEMEGKWATSVYKAINGEKLSKEDILSLKEFIVYQRQRTSAENRRSLEEREAILKECAESLYFNKGWNFDEQAENYCKERAKEGVSPAENVEMASKMVKYIADLDILIIRYNTEELLITTDSPVIVLNPFLKFQGFGFNNIGTVFLMPLSPSHLLIVYDGTLYSNNIEKLYIESNNAKEVLDLNKYQMIHAERMAFSSDIRFLSISEEILSNREKEIKRNKTEFLGAKGQRLIMTKVNGINYYYKLPYIELPRNYQRIPFHCREPIPRVYEEGWERKLSMQYEVLCIASERMEHKKFPSKIDLKIGCRRMESIAKKYWRRHERRFACSELVESKN